jgi:hypothetical protein
MDFFGSGALKKRLEYHRKLLIGVFGRKIENGHVVYNVVYGFDALNVKGDVDLKGFLELIPYLKNNCTYKL